MNKDIIQLIIKSLSWLTDLLLLLFLLIVPLVIIRLVSALTKMNYPWAIYSIYLGYPLLTLVNCWFISAQVN